MQKEIISANYKGHIIVADIIPAGSVPQVFCMHGAGNSSKEYYAPLRQLLLESSISSCALDFLGYGETGGNISQSSLKSRTEQARAIIEKARIAQPLIIIAGSMSGYNAIKLTEVYPVSLLVLFSPAVYSQDAYEIPFGDEFSSSIRKSRSWDNTDAWEILKNYKGKLIIVAAGEDNIVPFEVIKKIYDNTINATDRKILTIHGAPHRLFSIYFKKHPEKLKKVVSEVISFIK